MRGFRHLKLETVSWKEEKDGRCCCFPPFENSQDFNQETKGLNFELESQEGIDTHTSHLAILICVEIEQKIEYQKRSDTLSLKIKQNSIFHEEKKQL